MFAQVDLRRGASAFEKDQLMVRGQAPVGFHDLGEELLDAPGVIIRRRDLSPDFPEQDYLGAGIRRRLEQDRIHLDAWNNATGFGLQSLRPADLAAFRCRRGIE